MLAFGTVIVLIVLDNLFRPAYIKLLEKDLDVSIVATAQKNEEALSNNVRVTHIAVDGKDIDLSEADVQDDSEWAYDSKNDFLYAYNLKSEDKIDISLKNVHAFSITMVQERKR